MNINSAFEDYLKDRKMFYTQVRKVILRAVEKSSPCFMMEDILAYAEKHGMNLAKSTVYRNLKLMCAVGIIELKYCDGKCIFQRKSLDVPTYYISCHGCSREQNIKDPDLQQFILRWCRARGYATDGLVVKIDVVGKCRNSHREEEK
ncbi:MAG: transcriptional repressor [Lentisphaeria bacterium]